MEGRGRRRRGIYGDEMVAFEPAFVGFGAALNSKQELDLAGYDIFGSEFGAFGQVGVDRGRAEGAGSLGGAEPPALGAGGEFFEADEGLVPRGQGRRRGGHGGHVLGGRNDLERQHGWLDCWFGRAVGATFIQFCHMGKPNK